MSFAESENNDDNAMKGISENKQKINKLKIIDKNIMTV